jgi:tRNA(Met) C34 N-acetyltransferase TmcA
MFLPSALIIIMNEIKRGYYSVEMHNINADFSGVYTSLTIRCDVKSWLEENYENLKQEYDIKYKTSSYTNLQVSLWSICLNQKPLQRTMS